MLEVSEVHGVIPVSKLENNELLATVILPPCAQKLIVLYYLHSYRKESVLKIKALFEQSKEETIGLVVTNLFSLILTGVVVVLITCQFAF